MTLPVYALPFPRVSAGIPVPHLDQNGAYDWIEYLAGAVTVARAAVVHSSGSISVPNGPGTGTGPWNAGRTYVAFDTVDYDTTGMSDLTGGGHANQVLTAIEGGLYLAFAYGQWAASATGFRTVSIDIGGDAAAAPGPAQLPSAGGTFPTAMFATMFQELTAGQQVALRVDQNSGGALSFLGGKLALARVALS